MAYNTADLDDAWSAGLIHGRRRGRRRCPQYREIHEAVETQFPGATERERFHEALRQLVDLLVSGLIEGTVQPRRKPAGVADFEEVRAYPARLAAFTAEAARNQPGAQAVPASRGSTLPTRWAATGSARWSMIAELFRFFLANPGAAARSLMRSRRSTNRRTAWSATTSPA